MKARYAVRVVESFSCETTMGVADGETYPAASVTTFYTAGDLVKFRTKRDALAFARLHTPGAAYLPAGGR